MIINTKISDTIKNEKELRNWSPKFKMQTWPHWKKGNICGTFFYGDCCQGDHIGLEHKEFQINQKRAFVSKEIKKQTQKSGWWEYRAPEYKAPENMAP